MNRSSGWEIHLVKKPSQDTWWIEVGRDADSQFAQMAIHNPVDGLRVVKFLNRLLPQLEFYERFESECDERCKLEEELSRLNCDSDALKKRFDDAERRLRDIRHGFRLLDGATSKKRADEFMIFIRRAADLESVPKVARIKEALDAPT